MISVPMTLKFPMLALLSAATTASFSVLSEDPD